MKRTTKKEPVYLYELWWTGNGGIPGQSEYTAFDHKPTPDQIEQECIDKFGSPNDFPEGWRGFKYKRIKLQDIQSIIDKFHKADNHYNKAFQKRRKANKLLDFYLDNSILKKARGIK